MRSRCIILFCILCVFANDKAMAENEIQAIQNASEILREHFYFVFDTQSIDLDSQKPQDENVGISLVDVGKMDEVTIRYEGKTLKAKEDCVFPSLINNGFLVLSYAGREGDRFYASMVLCTPKDNLQHRYRMQQLLSILLGDTPSVEKSTHNDSDLEDIGTSLYKTLTEFKEIRTNMEFPEHLIEMKGEKRGDEFDVEKYFTVLKHISMKEGYRLDYVYQIGGISGSPILYSRKKDQPPYKNYEEYIDAVRQEAHLDEIKLINEEFNKKIRTVGITAAYEWQKKQLENYPNHKYWEWYLDDVCVDGTPESWLELIVLHLYGDQFYQFWHAGYNDTMIIPDYSTVSAVSEQYIFDERKVPPIISLLGSALDVRPLVEVKDKTISVSIVTFSKWRGFNEQVFSINKETPHRITKISDNKLIRYNSDVVF